MSMTARSVINEGTSIILKKNMIAQISSFIGNLFSFFKYIIAYSGLYVMNMIYSLSTFVPALRQFDTPTSALHR